MDAAQSEFGATPRHAGSLLEGLLLKSIKVEIPDKQDDKEEIPATHKEDNNMIIQQNFHVRPCFSTNTESQADTLYGENLVTTVTTVEIEHIKCEPPDEIPNIGDETSDSAVLLKSINVETPDTQNEEKKMLAMVKKEEMFIGPNLHVNPCLATGSESIAVAQDNVNLITNFKKELIESEPFEETPDLGQKESDNAVLLKSVKVEIPDEQDEEEEKIIERDSNVKSCFLTNNESTAGTQYGVNLVNNIKTEWININIPPDIGYKASGADMGLCSTSTLLRSVKKPEPEKIFICNDCGEQFNKKRHLKQHIRCHKTTSNGYLNCPECEYLALRRDTLDRHLRLHDKTRPFQCTECSYRYATKGHLQQHMKVQHAADKETFKIHSCNICVYKTSRLCNLKEHLKTHTGEKPFDCSICGHKFSKNSHLKRHMQIHTVQNPSQMCPYSSDTCDLKANMISHTHTVAKQFSCSICPHMFSKETDLETHLRSHIEKKPFSCSICPYICSRKSDLKRHARKHTGEKPFSCRMCRYQCSQKQNLKAHMLVHTGEKPFTCSECGQKFSKNGHLKRHFQVVHAGEKKFSCEICSYRCCEIRGFKAHMASHAREKPFDDVPVPGSTSGRIWVSVLGNAME